MVLADVENELFRENSRGLEGGSFFLTTILNRKEVRTKKGKENIEAFSDFYILKSDATFCNLFLHKYNLDDNVDNTPTWLKKGSKEEKVAYLHQLVTEALRDLLPSFAKVKSNVKLINDYPLVNGRLNLNVQGKKKNDSSSKLEALRIVDSDTAEATALMVKNHLPTNNFKDLKSLMILPQNTSSHNHYACTLCSYSTKYESICLAHIEKCLGKKIFKSIVLLLSHRYIEVT